MYIYYRLPIFNRFDLHICMPIFVFLWPSSSLPCRRRASAASAPRVCGPCARALPDAARCGASPTPQKYVFYNDE